MNRKRSGSGSLANAALLISGALVNLLFLIVLMTFSYLREEPAFWTEWSTEARDLVRDMYYPLLLLEFLLLCAFSGISVYLMISRYTSASLAVVLLPTLWGLFFMVILNSVANNLENLLNGRPLHWHPSDRWSNGHRIPAPYASAAARDLERVGIA